MPHEFVKLKQEESLQKEVFFLCFAFSLTRLNDLFVIKIDNLFFFFSIIVMLLQFAKSRVSVDIDYFYLGLVLILQIGFVMNKEVYFGMLFYNVKMVKALV
jgi:hypothetical protein